MDEEIRHRNRIRTLNFQKWGVEKGIVRSRDLRERGNRIGTEEEEGVPGRESKGRAEQRAERIAQQI